MLLAKLTNSFKYAWNGLWYVFSTQLNMRVHVLIAILVLLLGFTIGFTRTEMLILFIVIAMVFFAEIFNTAIETIIDIITPEFNELSKVAKDVAAGAVLLTSIWAFIIGIFLFTPYMIKMLEFSKV